LFYVVNFFPDVLCPFLVHFCNVIVANVEFHVKQYLHFVRLRQVIVTVHHGPKWMIGFFVIIVHVIVRRSCSWFHNKILQKKSERELVGLHGGTHGDVNQQKSLQKEFSQTMQTNNELLYKIYTKFKLYQILELN
jgi:hypothetical protein